jgi:hypothetical protein
MAVTECLLAKGANVHSRSKLGYTPLMMAAGSGHVAEMEILVANGADLAAITSLGGTVVHIAAISGHVEVLEWLAKQDGIDLTVDDNTTTALHLAALGGHYHVVNWMIETQVVDTRTLGLFAMPISEDILLLPDRVPITATQTKAKKEARLLHVTRATGRAIDGGWQTDARSNNDVRAKEMASVERLCAEGAGIIPAFSCSPRAGW